MTLRVLLDIFSGLPNPQWQLGAEQSLAMVTLVSGLSAAEPGEMPALPDLGYRGFEVSGFDADCNTYRVFRGYVDACGSIMRDPDNHAEIWLLQSAERTLEPGLYAELLVEIAEK